MARRWRDFTASLALAAFCAAPAAAETPQPAAPVPARPLLASAALATSAAAPERAFEQAEAAPTGDSKPFFKTKRGVAVIVLMVVGTGWVLYSKSNDRVKSPAS